MKSPYAAMIDKMTMGEEISPPPTKRWGLFDIAGAPKGFWSNDVWPDQEDGSRNEAIPTEAVEITNEVWQQLIDNQPRARYVDGAVVVSEYIGSNSLDWGSDMKTVLGGDFYVRS